MKNKFNELLTKSLQESKKYAEKKKAQDIISNEKLKEASENIPEELAFINSLDESDKQEFLEMIEKEFCFIYYPGFFINYVYYTPTADWDKRYYEVKKSFLSHKEMLNYIEKYSVEKKKSIFSRVRNRKTNKK